MISAGVLRACLILLIFDKTDGDCSKTSELPELQKRSRLYQADGVRGSDPYVNDRYLYPDWYSVILDEEQWLMPDSNFKPKPIHCGTVQPIYLRDSHPDINTLTEQPVSLVACEMYPFHNCLNTLTVEIRKCGNDVQYYLKGTSSNSAFCFDPPSLQNVTDFTDAPTVKLGKLTVSPVLNSYEQINNGNTYLIPVLEFLCVETGGNIKTEQTLLFTTYWYINDELIFTNDSANGLSSLTEQRLRSKNIGLGIQIRCGVKIARSATSLKTNLTTSINFFAGIKVNEKIVNMFKNEVRTITFQPTIPFGCYSGPQTGTGNCNHKVHMIVPDQGRCELADTDSGGSHIVNIVNYHNSQAALCGFEIEGCYANESLCTKTMQPVDMNITTRFLSNDDPDSYRLRLITQNAGVHEIWKGYNVTDVVVYIKDNVEYKNKVCFSHVDPHMQTADGKRYENNDYAGEFILYWNEKYNIMVQERTTSCNSNKAFCTCAVAVRAGGDIFLINLCNDLKFIGMTSCKDNGALVIRKNSEFDYQVQTNIGTLIKIRIFAEERYKEMMNIDIVMAPKDFGVTKGLCGLFDNDKNNDFRGRNGNTYKDRKKFILDWKLSSMDSNFLSPTCVSDVKTWVEDGQQLFCSCNCYDDKNQCGAPESEALCSPSQYINCTVKLQKTDDLCRDFAHKCHPSSRRKRSAFAFDPEKEMKRRAALAYKRTLRTKRQSNVQSHLTIEEVTTLCTNEISNSVAVEKYSNLLGGYNYSVIIEHCIFDVYEGQDTGWVMHHEVAMNDAVQVGFKRNALFTENHTQLLLEFKRQYCPSNCSGNGNCSDEAICSCYEGYFGPDCGKEVTQAPRIEDIEGGGVCDTRYGSECKCFEVQIDALAETFYCRRKIRNVYINGSSTTKEEQPVVGFYKNFFTAECCFQSHTETSLNNRLDAIMFYQFYVSLSNDGVHFGQEETLHVYNSLCQNYYTDINGTATILLKEGTCFIMNNCVEGNETDTKDECNKCIPKQNRHAWTFYCTKTDEENGQRSMLYIILAVAGVVVILFCMTVFCILKRRPKNNREDVNSLAIQSNFSRSSESARSVENTAFEANDDLNMGSDQFNEYEKLDKRNVKKKESEYTGIVR